MCGQAHKVKAAEFKTAITFNYQTSSFYTHTNNTAKQH